MYARAIQNRSHETVKESHLFEGDNIGNDKKGGNKDREGLSDSGKASMDFCAWGGILDQVPRK